jgi:hypothetical protein
MTINCVLTSFFFLFPSFLFLLSNIIFILHKHITGAPIGPPPDLPSLLLHNRIVYIGMPLVPAVTELIIAELLYLNYESTDPITMYINSSGTI